jgi:hypothetical protein
MFEVSGYRTSAFAGYNLGLCVMHSFVLHATQNENLVSQSQVVVIVVHCTALCIQVGRLVGIQSSTRTH